MKTKFLFLMLFIMNVFLMNAQTRDEVKLVVSADGATKEEATKTALRSAIEQAYGTFVSANTTILNDELVKDEIVTVANGNIKEYKEISFNQLDNGRVLVALQAVVSVSKLISYAQSKGASTEFAGATFAMNMKMKELNKKNEMAALENLLVQIKQMMPYAYNRTFGIGTPTEVKSIENEHKHNYQIDMCSIILSVIGVNNGSQKVDNMAMDYYYGGYSKYLYELLTNGGEPTKKAFLFLDKLSNYYEVPASVSFVENENTEAFIQLIFGTLESLSLTEAERKEMESLNISYSERIIKGGRYTGKKVYLRNSVNDLFDWEKRLRASILHELSNFVMVDNLGGRSYFKDADEDMLSFIEDKGYKELWNRSRSYVEDRKYNSCGSSLFEDYIADGLGLFSPMVLFQYSHLTENDKINADEDEYKKRAEILFPQKLKELVFSFKFFIPKDKIMEYTNFSIESKTK